MVSLDPPESISVLLVDDHTMFRQGLRQMLQSAGLLVIGEASNGSAGVKLISELRPDVVVMDLHMPIMGGIDAVKEVVAADPTSRILMLTVSTDQDDVLDALAAGATGYVLKDSPAEDVVRAVRAARDGDSAISPVVASRLVEHVRTGRGRSVAVQAPPDNLTARELQILELIAKGMENAQIAEALFISPSTAKNHVAHVLDKLQLENRVQAAVYAVRAGIV